MHVFLEMYVPHRILKMPAVEEIETVNAMNDFIEK